MTDQYGVWRFPEGRLAVRMPYRPGNRAWLKETLGARIRPDWDKRRGCWWVARAHFTTVVEALAQRFGRIDVYIDFRGLERCDTRCKRARGRECDCRCFGKHHGRGITEGWKLVTDTVEVQPTGVHRRHIVVVREGGPKT